jgi:hypothetical protein
MTSVFAMTLSRSPASACLRSSVMNASRVRAEGNSRIWISSGCPPVHRYLHNSDQADHRRSGELRPAHGEAARHPGGQRPALAVVAHLGVGPRAREGRTRVPRCPVGIANRRCAVTTTCPRLAVALTSFSLRPHLAGSKWPKPSLYRRTEVAGRDVWLARARQMQPAGRAYLITRMSRYRKTRPGASAEAAFVLVQGCVCGLDRVL